MKTTLYQPFIRALGGTLLLLGALHVSAGQAHAITHGDHVCSAGAAVDIHSPHTTVLCEADGRRFSAVTVQNYSADDSAVLVQVATPNGSEECWQFACWFEIGPAPLEMVSGSDWKFYPFAVDHVFIDCECV